MTLSEEITSTKEGEKIWHQERIIFEATERICELMEQQNVSRTKLAEILGKSKGYVTQLLDGTSNMTLRTLSDVFVSLGRAAHVTDGTLSISNVPPMNFTVFNKTVDWCEANLFTTEFEEVIPNTDVTLATSA